VQLKLNVVRTRARKGFGGSSDPRGFDRAERPNPKTADEQRQQSGPRPPGFVRVERRTTEGNQGSRDGERKGGWEGDGGGSGLRCGGSQANFAGGEE
jgi:hypothetical protein